jgi:hypothetical protein
MTLQATLDRNGGVKCATTVTTGADGFSVLLTKLTPGALTERHLPHGITVSTVTASPVAALYHSLHHVYMPLLQQHTGAGGDGDGGVRVQVASLPLHARGSPCGGTLAHTVRRSRREASLRPTRFLRASCAVLATSPGYSWARGNV